MNDTDILGFTVTNNDPDVHGLLEIGFICGINNGTIRNVKVENSIMDLDVGNINDQNDNYVVCGAICGTNYFTITDCEVVDCVIKCYAGTKYKGVYGCVGGAIGLSNNGKTNRLYCHNNTLFAHVKADANGPKFNCTSHGRPRVYIGGVIGLLAGGSNIGLMVNNNSIDCKLERNCNHTDHIEKHKGAIIGYEIN